MLFLSLSVFFYDTNALIHNREDNRNENEQNR